MLKVRETSRKKCSRDQTASAMTSAELTFCPMWTRTWPLIGSTRSRTMVVSGRIWWTGAMVTSSSEFPLPFLDRLPAKPPVLRQSQGPPSPIDNDAHLPAADRQCSGPTRAKTGIHSELGLDGKLGGLARRQRQD